MTTVIAVQCWDGVILCADSQETSDWGMLGTKENVSKIHPVGYRNEWDKNCMLGCAGKSNYIKLFREHVGKVFLNRGDRSYFEALDEAVRNYTSYVTTRSRDMGDISLRGSDFPSAIFVGYEPTDDKIRVYSLEPPDPPTELSEPHRIAIGTGQLYASLLFSIAEMLMYRIGFDWTSLSTKLVSQFCYMALGRIMTYDRDTGMSSSFYRIDRTGHWPLNNQQIFPGHGKEEKYRLSVLLKTALDEFPTEKLFELLKTYNVSEIVSQFLGSVNDRSPSER